MMRSREQDIRRITVIGALINIILTIFKIIAGILGQSAAIVADGIHSLSYSGTWKHCIMGSNHIHNLKRSTISCNSAHG